jgi:hypothetical protein
MSTCLQISFLAPAIFNETGGWSHSTLPTGNFTPIAKVMSLREGSIDCKCGDGVMDEVDMSGIHMAMGPADGPMGEGMGTMGMGIDRIGMIGMGVQQPQMAGLASMVCLAPRVKPDDPAAPVGAPVAAPVATGAARPADGAHGTAALAPAGGAAEWNATFEMSGEEAWELYSSQMSGMNGTAAGGAGGMPADKDSFIKMWDMLKMGDVRVRARACGSSPTASLLACEAAVLAVWLRPGVACLLHWLATVRTHVQPNIAVLMCLADCQWHRLLPRTHRRLRVLAALRRRRLLQRRGAAVHMLRRLRRPPLPGVRLRLHQGGRRVMRAERNRVHQ